MRSNVEMMCQFEGDIVNSLYDCFLISWHKQFSVPPVLPCVSNPAEANRVFYFGDRNAFIRKNGNDGLIVQNITMDETHPNTAQIHESNPIHELINESERYDKENHMNTTIPITQRLNVSESVEATWSKHDLDFTPFYMHTSHNPVPMALVNRQPQRIPGHHDFHNPQNAAWIQGYPISFLSHDTSSQISRKGSFYSVSRIQCTSHRRRSSRSM